MEILKVVEEREKIQAQLEVLNEAIRKYSDGFFYIATLESNGDRWYFVAKNAVNFTDFVEERRELDDYCRLEVWTNNKEYSLPERAGKLYKVEDTSQIKHKGAYDYLMQNYTFFKIDAL